jgi:hypothetical protein
VATPLTGDGTGGDPEIDEIDTPPQRQPLPPRPVNGIAPGPGVRIGGSGGTFLPSSEPVAEGPVEGPAATATPANPFSRVPGAATPGVIIPTRPSGLTPATDPSVRQAVPEP